MPLSLLILALSAFAIGTTEFVIMGLLPDVAADLGVSIPGAGWLVTGYALGRGHRRALHGAGHRQAAAQGRAGSVDGHLSLSATCSAPWPATTTC